MDNFPEFKGFSKIARLSRPIVITEKIDGTNGLIYIDEQNNIFAGSRKRWLWGSIQNEIHNDNHGFARWVMENKNELLKLDKGYHYGEWWGSGIQRGYGLIKGEKRFSLFNTGRWVDTHLIPVGASGFPFEYSEEYLNELKKQSYNDKLEYCPKCCYVVPILYEGKIYLQDFYAPDEFINYLKVNGSKASLGFMKPEGIVIYHKQGNMYFKKTIENDEQGKGQK